MITKINSGDKIDLSGKKVLKFYSTTCLPCKRLDTILAKMEKEFSDIVIYAIDIDENEELARKYKVLGLPTMIFIFDNSEVNKMTGLLGTEKIREMFKELQQK